MAESLEIHKISGFRSGVVLNPDTPVIRDVLRKRLSVVYAY